jgi:hypothetical protein
VSDTWKTARNTVRTLRRKARLLGAQKVRGLQRLDAAIAVVVVAVALAVGVVAAGIVLGHEKYGLFDPPPVRPVPDDRKLTNIRGAPFGAPYADIAVEGRSGVLLAIRRDGVVHQLNLETRLWSEESMGAAREMVAGDILALSAECPSPADPGSCLGDLVWALSQDGGLAVREEGTWRSLIGDVAWHGMSGAPVDHESILSAAVSEDRRWILFGTDKEGLGLFSLEGNHWVPIDLGVQREVLGNGAQVTRILWALGRFWIGSDEGLAALVLKNSKPQLTPHGSILGIVRDLEQEPGGSVLVLSEGPCEVSGEGCLAVHRFESSERSRELIGEKQRDRKLSEGTLRHVALQAGSAVTFGDAGVHRYDPVRRSWRTLHERSVAAVLETIDGEIVFAASTGEVIGISGGEQTESWQLPDDERVGSLFFGSGASVLALTDTESIYRLEGDGRTTQLHEKSSAGLDIAEARAAGRLGDSLLLLGDGKAALHDVRTRRYRSLPESVFPQGLFHPDVSLRSDGAQALWAYSDGSEITRLSLASSAGGPLDVRFLGLPEPAFRIRPDPLGAFALFKDLGPGRIEVQSSGLSVKHLVRHPRPTQMGVPRMAEVQSDGSLLMIDDRALWRYDFELRGWLGPFPTGITEQALIDFAPTNGVNYFVGDKGLLTQVDDKGQSESVLGAGPTLPFGLDQLEDATVDDAGRILLAGQGRIVAYSSQDHAVVSQWSPKGAGPIRLSGAIGSTPVGQRGDVLFVGDSVLTLPGATGVSVSITRDGIVTIQSRDGHRFLALFPRAASLAPSNAVCFFAESAPPSPAVQDAAALPDGRRAVLVGGRIAVYDPSIKRWQRTDWRPSNDAFRIRRLGDWIVANSRNGLSTAPIQALDTPDSCAATPVHVDAETLAAKQVSVHAVLGEVGVLGGGGKVDLWRTGQVRPLLPAASDAPDPDSLSRVFADGDTLFFLSPSDAWWYEMDARSWSRHPFQGFDPQGVETLDARPLGQGRFAVTLWMRDGRSLGGIVDRATPEVTFLELRGLSLPKVVGDFTAFVDAAEWGGLSYFLFQDRLAVFGPDMAHVQADLLLPEARQDRRLVVANNLVGLEEGPEGAATSLYFFPSPPRTDELTPLARVAAWVDLTQVRAFAVMRNGALRLIDQLGVARSCGIVPGLIDLAACDPKNMPPVRLDPERLSSVYGLADTELLLVMKDGLRLLDRASRAIRLVQGGPPASMLTDAEVFSEAEVFWIQSSAGGVWRIDDSDQAQQVGTDVVRLYERLNKKSPIWMAFDDGSLRPLDGAGRPLSIGEALAFFGSTDAPTERFVALSRFGAGVAAIRADGAILKAEGSDLMEVDLLQRPYAPLISDPRAALPGLMSLDGRDVSGWWIQDGSLLLFLHDAICAEVDLAMRSALTRAPGTEPPSRCVHTAIVRDMREAAPQRRDVIRAVTRRGSQLVDFATDSGVYQLRDGALSYRATVRGAFQGLDRTDNRTEDIRAALGQLSDGTYLLDIPKLTQQGDEVRISLTPGVEQVAVGTIRRETLPALNTEWLRWLRNSARFEVGASGASENVAPADIVDNGHFLPDVPGRFYLSSDNQLVGVNRHGHWTYPLRDGVAQAPSYQPADLPADLDIAHGRLLVGSQSMPVEGGPLVPDEDETKLTHDRLTVREQWRSQAVSAQLGSSVLSANALGARGFAFDTRISIGWRGAEPVLLTPIGVVSARRFELLGGSPAGLLTGAGQLHSMASELYANAPGIWLKLSPDGTWSAVPDPTRNWIMAQDSDHVWSKQDGETRIDPAPGAAPWVAERTNDGGFVADHLIAGAGSRDALVLNTAAGTLFVDTVEALRRTASALNRTTAPSVVEPVGTLLNGGGGTIISGEGASAMRWDLASRSWLSIADPNFLNTRPAAAVNGLSFNLVKGRWRAEVEMETLDGGGPKPRSFTWRRNHHFPFDMARAVENTTAGGLAVGTDFGMRVLQGGRMRLIDLSQDNRPGPVSRIGRPFDAPDRWVARSGSACAVVAAGAPWQRCPTTIALERMHLGETRYWRWSLKGGVEGRYLDSKGRSIGPKLAGTLPHRFPHDAPRDLLSCNNRVFALRGDGLLERYADRSGHPNMSDGLWPTPTNGTARLYCVRRDQNLGGETLTPSLFLLAGKDVHRFTGAGWDPVSGQIAAAVSAYEQQDLLPHWGRLRARRDSAQGWRIEHRGLDETWRALAWRNDRLAVDKLLGPGTEAHGRLWIATTAGLASFNSAGGFGIDLESFLVVPPVVDDKECRIELIDTLNGRTWRAPDEAGRETRLRCADGRVFQGALDGSQDRDVFRPADEDPFDGRIVQPVQPLGPGAIRWRLSRPPGSTQSAEAFFGVPETQNPLGEKASLIEGRFAFDEVQELAIFQDDRVEQLSPLGWHRLNPTLQLNGMERWSGDDVNAEDVQRLSVNRDTPEGAPSLCLDRRDGPSIAVLLDGRRDEGRTCATFLGYDGLWAYRQDGRSVRAEAGARNGPTLVRRLVDGRFTDLRAKGMPARIRNEAGDNFLTPTEVGVTVLDETGRPRGLYALEKGGAVAVRGGQPSYLTAAGEVTLGGREGHFCPGVVEALKRIDLTAPLLDVKAAPEGAWDIRFEHERMPVQARLYCAQQATRWLVDISVDTHARFKANATDWGNRGDKLSLRIVDGRIRLGDGLRTEAAAPVDLKGQLRRLTAGPSSFFIATDEEIYIGDFDALLTHLHETGRTFDLPEKAATGASSDPASPATGSEAWTTRSLTSEERAVIQRVLADGGYYAGPIDGVFGEVTKAAVSAYQKAKGDAMTGSLTRAQVRRLFAAAVGE